MGGTPLMNENATGDTDQGSAEGEAPAIGGAAGESKAEPRDDASAPSGAYWSEDAEGAPAFRWSRSATEGSAPSETVPSETAPSETAEAETVGPPVEVAERPGAATGPSDEPAPSGEAPLTEEAPSSEQATGVSAEAGATPLLSEEEAAALAAAEEARRQAEIERRAREAAEEAAKREAEERAAAEAAAVAQEQAERKAFIEENTLGSLLYGARATLGKSDLKAVERAIRIKARYLLAIEQLDAENLPSEAYLPGYVKTYAAYLSEALPLTPEEALSKFRREMAEKLGLDPDTAAEAPEPGPSPVKVSEKVAPRISRDAIASAKAGGAAVARDAQAAAENPDTARSGARAAKSRPTPAEALRARAAAARAEGAVSDPLARARRAATLDPMAKIERMGDAARAAAPKAPSGRATAASAEVVARRRQSAMEREAQRVAEIARSSGKARAAALRGAREPGVDAVGPGVALLTAAAVIGGLSYGAWSLLTEAQKVTADGDAARPLTVVERLDPGVAASPVARPSAAAYEPGGVLAEAPGASRQFDGPIGGIPREEPGLQGGADAAFAASEGDQVRDALAAVDAALAAGGPAAEAPDAAAPRETVWTGPAFALRALDVSWLRVRDRSGAVVFAGQMDQGALKALDPGLGPFEIRAGNAGGVALAVNGEVFGPIGADGEVATVLASPQTAASLPPLPEETAALALESAAETSAPSAAAPEPPAPEPPAPEPPASEAAASTPSPPSPRPETRIDGPIGEARRP